MKYLVIFLMIFSFIIPEEVSEEKVYEFTEEEVKIFHSSISELEQKDSLNVLLIKELQGQIFDYNMIMKNDSLIIQQLEFKNKLQSEMIDLVKPKWYENRYLWFFGGFFSFYLATEAVNNLK
tara:strand:+ start:571 stop:936 length:366 start_codon:yes stop_codon:yes gene_type:complete